MSPYEQLAELAERALTLAEADQLDELNEVLARGEALAATLPERPPPSARAPLARAVATQERLSAHLGSRLAATRSELARVGRSRDAASAYAGPPAATLERTA
jgi:hypothetical protein